MILLHNTFFTKKLLLSKIVLFSLFKRFMLSNSKHLLKKTLTINEKDQIAKAALNFCSFINNTNVVKDFSQNKIENSYNQIYNYLSSDEGTIQLKTTLLSSLGNISLSLKKAITCYNNSKLLAYDPTTNIPIRSLAELEIMNGFIRRFDPYIKNVLLTGDKIQTQLKKNPYQDVIMNLTGNLFSDSQRTFDIKAGNFAKNEFFKGEVRQIYINNEELVAYPNKPINLTTDHYMQIASRLKSTTFLNEAHSRMNKKEFDFFLSLAEKPYYMLLENKSYQEIEEIFMEIQRLPTFPKAFNFVNVYQIKNTSLTEKEMNFLNEVISHVNPNVLDNPRIMQQFLLKALKTYNYQMDPQIFKTLKPLKNTQEWLASEIDQLGTDIFT